jgi:hypothetical protein
MTLNATAMDSVDDSFIKENCKNVVKAAIAEEMARERVFDAQKVPVWAKAIIDSSLKQLQSLHCPFKYSVTAVITQRCGAGITTVCSTYWDTKYDGTCFVHWNNNNIDCVVTVYAFSLVIDPVDEEDD